MKDMDQAEGCSLTAIYRASVRQRGRRGYHRLGKEIITDSSKPKAAKVPINAKKVVILPMRMLKTAKLSKPEITASVPPQPARLSTKDAARSHPLLNFLGGSGRKAATLKPEFIRYLEYVKEGGRWDADSNRPVIYFK